MRIRELLRTRASSRPAWPRSALLLAGLAAGVAIAVLNRTRGAIASAVDLLDEELRDEDERRPEDVPAAEPGAEAPPRAAEPIREAPIPEPPIPEPPIGEAPIGEAPIGEAPARDRWAPAARIAALAAGTGIALVARGVDGAGALRILGVLVALRGATNVPMRRLVGLDAARRALAGRGGGPSRGDPDHRSR